MIAKRIFALLLMCILMFPAYAVEETTEPVSNNVQEQEVATSEEPAELGNDSLNSAGENMLQAKDDEDNGLKEPFDKKLLIKKFIIAMLCVAGCSLLLYISLSLYNRIRDGIIADDTEMPEGEEPLEAPQDITEAVKTFVDKTHWNGV